MKLYEITEQIRELFSTEEIDVDRLNELEMAFADKIDSCCAILKEYEADAAGYKAEVDRLATLKRTADNRAEWLKDYIRTAMEGAGESKVKTARFNVSLGKPSQTVSITGAVPEQYQVVKVSEDKAALSRDLKAGKEIEGATLVDGKARLMIK